MPNGQADDVVFLAGTSWDAGVDPLSVEPPPMLWNILPFEIHLL